MAQSELAALHKKFADSMAAQDLAAAQSIAAAFIKMVSAIDSALKDFLTRWREYSDKHNGVVPPGWVQRQPEFDTLMASIHNEVDGAAIHTQSIIENGQNAAVLKGVNDGQKLIRAAAPVPLSTTNLFTTPPDAAFRILKRPAVDKMVGRLQDGTPLTRLLSTLAPETVGRAKNALVKGVYEGQNPNVVARDLRAELSVSLARAKTIARTEVLGTYRESVLETYRANSDVVAGWIWNAHLGRRSCAMCIAMHGTKHQLSEPFGSHPNCRCSPSPWTKTFEELGFGDIPESRPSLPTGEQWFEKQSEKVQQEILGHGKFELYKSGVIDLHDLVGYDTDKVWGPRRWELPLKAVVPIQTAAPVSRDAFLDHIYEILAAESHKGIPYVELTKKLQALGIEAPGNAAYNDVVKAAVRKDMMSPDSRFELKDRGVIGLKLAPPPPPPVIPVTDYKAHAFDILEKKGPMPWTELTKELKARGVQIPGTGDYHETVKNLIRKEFTRSDGQFELKDRGVVGLRDGVKPPPIIVPPPNPVVPKPAPKPVPVPKGPSKVVLDKELSAIRILTNDGRNVFAVTINGKYYEVSTKNLEPRGGIWWAKVGSTVKATEEFKRIVLPNVGGQTVVRKLTSTKASYEVTVDGKVYRVLDQNDINFITLRLEPGANSLLYLRDAEVDKHIRFDDAYKKIQDIIKEETANNAPYARQAAIDRRIIEEVLYLQDTSGSVGMRPDYTPKAQANSYMVAEVQKSIRHMNQIATGNLRVSAVRIVDGGPSLRAYASGTTIALKSREAPRTIVHELGHILESQDPEYLRRALDFYDKRTMGEQTQSMNILEHTSGYGPNEKGRRDKFINGYVGKDYGRQATEIHSMGIEEMFANPGRFLERDPDMFKFIFDSLRGREYEPYVPTGMP